jgi:hypothetical protein
MRPPALKFKGRPGAGIAASDALHNPLEGYSLRQFTRGGERSTTRTV